MFLHIVQNMNLQGRLHNGERLRYLIFQRDPKLKGNNYKNDTRYKNTIVCEKQFEWDDLILYKKSMTKNTLNVKVIQ